MPTQSSVVSSIKAKLDAMTQASQQKRSLIVRPPRGQEVTYRIVPYKHGPDPFNELYFHYDIGPVKTILCGRTAGVDEKCPICEYAQFLLKGEKNDKNFALYKRLKSRQRAYVPVIVRGQEEEGVRFWGIGKQTYNTIAQLFIDAEYGDISDPVKGRDIKVLATAPTPQFIYGQVQVRPAANGSALSSNALQAAAWIKECPSVFEAFTKMPEADVQNALDAFIAEGDTPASSSDSGSPAVEEEAVEVSESSDDQLANLYAEIQKKGQAAQAAK